MKKVLPILTIVFVLMLSIAAIAAESGGLVAVKVDGGVYLSWQHTGEVYKLYRDGSLILTTTATNYTDKEGNINSVYALEGKDSVTVWATNHIEIPLNAPQPTREGVTYSPNDAAIDDLDGDGEYEIVLKWDPSDSKDAATGGNSDRVYIDAYKLDGTFLWRINMGVNIRAGAHDTQMVVYDLDGNGKAEVALRTCDGTIDGTGKTIGDPNAVYTNNWSGKNLEGPLFLSVFEGVTGKEICRVPYDPQNNEPNTLIFGDDAGNRSERYNACVAYLDGKTPHLVTQRGYYHGRAGKGPGRTVVAAYTFDGTTLTKTARFDTMDPGNDKYIGQGNHNLSVGDVDNDGCDEIFFGSLTLDNDLSVLWCSGKGHGDAQHLGDFDPDNEGLEYFSVHESEPWGYTVYDAATGDVIYDIPGGKDTGRGMIANLGPFRGNYIVNVGSGARRINSLGETVNIENNTMNFRIYWDGDLYDEMLDGTRITDVNNDGSGSVILDSAQDGCASNNGTKATPCLTADFMGDWREEVIWRKADNSAICIYTTTIPTEFSLPPLMTDHIYRMGIVWQNSSYNQPPHLSYYPEAGIRLTVNSDIADINGCKLTLDSPAYIENGRTMVPLRFIGESMDAAVGYDNGIVTIEKSGSVIKMTPGETLYTVNGVQYSMEAPATIANNRTMVPVRVIADAFGMNVDWNAEAGIVTIKRGKARRDKVKIFIAGDSTGQSYRENMAPQAGWGQMLTEFFDDSVIVENRAMAGRSLKSFFNEGRWASILNDAREGDYVIIQFGHNDGAWNKPERYISHEDFTAMLENEYIIPAIEKGLNVIIATQTQSRWFGEDGKIGEPGDGVSYVTLLRDAAAKFNLQLIDVNKESRNLANSYGVEGSKALYLHAAPGEYSKYPDGVEDNTHFSYCGAFKIAEIIASSLCKIPDLAARQNDAYVQIAQFSDTYTFDVRGWGFAEKFRVAIKGGGNVKINGETYLTWNTKGDIVTEALAADGKIVVETDKKITVEVTPVFTFAPTGGINTAQGEYSISLPPGLYDFAFTKNDRERGNIYINGNVVGVNVDMYGTVNVPEGTRHTFTNYYIDGNANIKVDGKTTTLKKAEAARTPSILGRKTKVFVGGDSTLCNYYPVIPETTEDEIQPGTIRTGWAQVLDRYLTDDYEVVNLAASGDWARNWRDWVFPTVLANGQQGDVFIIQFGINDRNRDDKTHDTMKNALKEMIEKAQAKGITVILVKPQPSVGYSWGNAGDFEIPNGNNGGFFNAVEEVARETGCSFVDLNRLAGENFAAAGREFVSKNYQLWDYGANVMADKLHISFAGASKCAFLFAEEAQRQGLLKIRKPMKAVKIVAGIYVFENGEETKIFNSTDQYKTVNIEGTNITIAPFAAITKAGALNE